MDTHSESPPATHGRAAEDLSYDIVVIGGGVAGHSAAVAAARLGSKVVLVQDRPVLGGNSSSEIRVWAIGAATQGYFRNARETGIVEEATLETAYRSEGLPPKEAEPWPMWDIVLKEWCDREPNLDVFLNTRVHEVTVADDRIVSVTALQTSTEKAFHFHAAYFIESSGDGEIGAKAGAAGHGGSRASSAFARPSVASMCRTRPCVVGFSSSDTAMPGGSDTSGQDLMIVGTWTRCL